MACTKNTCLYLRSVIGFSVVVFLDYYYRDGLYLFVGSEPLITFIANPATSYLIIIISRTAVNNPCILMTAKWTLHKFSPVLYLLLLRKSGILMDLASTLLSSGAVGLERPDKELTVC